MGKTGLQLSTLSFGSWVTFHKQINDSIADELMGIAYDAGVNFFDNAEVYAAGESEKMMGRILNQKKCFMFVLVTNHKKTTRVSGFVLFDGFNLESIVIN